jgi:uncharacterized membrane protein
MSERELVDWLGAGNAEPGSVAYKHAEHVLSMKQREAARTERDAAAASTRGEDWAADLRARARRVELQEAVAPSAERRADRLTQGHLALLALPFVVFAAMIVPTRSVLLSVLSAVFVVGLLFLRPVRVRVARLLAWIDDR